MWSWRRTEKIKWPENVTNKVLQRIRDKEIASEQYQVNLTGYILRRNRLIRDTNEG